MSDTDLREVERRYRQTGALEDEAAWLRARLRAGSLEPDRLDLAAWLGHPAARRALAERAPKPAPGPDHWTSVEAPAIKSFLSRLTPPATAIVIRTLEAYVLAAFHPDRPEELNLAGLDAWFADRPRQGSEALGEGDRLGTYGPLALLHLRTRQLLLAISYAATACGGIAEVYAALREALIAWAIAEPDADTDHTGATGS